MALALVVANAAAASASLGYVLLSNLPGGTGQSLLFTECAKYGDVKQIYYNPDRIDMMNHCEALVAFDTRDTAETAVKKLKKRCGLFGTDRADPVEVQLGTSEDASRMLQTSADEPESAPTVSSMMGSRFMSQLRINMDVAPAQEVRPTQPTHANDRNLEGRDKERRAVQAHPNESTARRHRDAKPCRDLPRYRDERSDGRPRNRGAEYDSQGRRPRHTQSLKDDSRSRSPPRRSYSRDNKRCQRTQRKTDRGRSDCLASLIDESDLLRSPARREREEAGPAPRCSRGGFDIKKPKAEHTPDTSTKVGARTGGIVSAKEPRQIKETPTATPVATPGPRPVPPEFLGCNSAQLGSMQNGMQNLMTPGGALMAPADFYEGPPVLTDAGRPNANVYVGSVPTGISEMQFQHMFSSYGQVLSSRLMPSRATPGKVCGFVRYTTVNEAKYAVAAMHSRVINGQKMKVKFSNQI